MTVNGDDVVTKLLCSVGHTGLEQHECVFGIPLTFYVFTALKRPDLLNLALINSTGSAVMTKLVYLFLQACFHLYEKCLLLK